MEIGRGHQFSPLQYALLSNFAQSKNLHSPLPSDGVLLFLAGGGGDEVI